MENGELLRTMNVRDGFALKRATQAGYKVAIITGGRSQGVALRMQSLGVSHVFSGIQDKLTIFEDYCARESIDPAQVLYMGDDMADIPVMRRVGLLVCPSHSIPGHKNLCLCVAIGWWKRVRARCAGKSTEITRKMGARNGLLQFFDVCPIAQFGNCRALHAPTLLPNLFP